MKRYPDYSSLGDCICYEAANPAHGTLAINTHLTWLRDHGDYRALVSDVCFSGLGPVRYYGDLDGLPELRHCILVLDNDWRLGNDKDAKALAQYIHYEAYSRNMLVIINTQSVSTLPPDFRELVSARIVCHPGTKNLKIEVHLSRRNTKYPTAYGPICIL